MSENGLFSSGATLNYAYGSGSGGNATISNAVLASHWTNTFLNLAEFDNSSGKQFGRLEGLVSGLPPVPVKPAIGTNYVLLGKVTFTGGTNGNVTNLSLSTDQNSAFSNLLIGGDLGIEVTPLNFVGGSIATITAVPEPTSLFAGLFLGAAGIGMRRWRNKVHKNELQKCPSPLTP